LAAGGVWQKEGLAGRTYYSQLAEAEAARRGIELFD
jgi:hypothetical protein